MKKKEALRRLRKQYKLVTMINKLEHAFEQGLADFMVYELENTDTRTKYLYPRKKDLSQRFEWVRGWNTAALILQEAHWKYKEPSNE